MVGETTWPRKYSPAAHQRSPEFAEDPLSKGLSTLSHHQGDDIRSPIWEMKSFPLSTRINTVPNDDPDCVVPWHRDLSSQSTLFG